MSLLKKIGDTFKRLIKQYKTNPLFAVFFTVFLVALVAFVVIFTNDLVQDRRMRKANSDFYDHIHNAELSTTPVTTRKTESTPEPTLPHENTAELSATPIATPEPTLSPSPTSSPSPTLSPTPSPSPSPAMTAGGLAAIEKNKDYVGWLELLGPYHGGNSEKNRINYPVFQTFDNPDTPYDANKPETNEGWFYLNHDANGKPNKYGSLFIDDRCQVGVGTSDNNYANGVKPSSNIIIFGHNIVNYIMFGALKQFWTSDTFIEEHHSFSFTTCYEYREYEIIAYFEDKVPEDNTYYFGSFVNCKTQDDFDKWYSFIKKKSKKKLDVTAEFGDEFVTLVTCATADSSPRRTVVVGKRIK